MHKILRTLVWVGIGVLIGIVVLGTRSPAHAYPEYADRTGEQCTTCHVSPAGGGPRTLRGLLWSAAGKPDKVPPLPGSEAKTGAAALDGPTLYNQFECSRCHGTVGEGGVGPALNQTEWTTEQLTDVIRNGKDAMKGYSAAAMTDEEMNALIPFVQAVGRGEVQSTVVLYKRQLPAPQLSCGSQASAPARVDCGGN